MVACEKMADRINAFTLALRRHLVFELGEPADDQGTRRTFCVREKRGAERSRVMGVLVTGDSAVDPGARFQSALKAPEGTPIDGRARAIEPILQGATRGAVLISPARQHLGKIADPHAPVA